MVRPHGATATKRSQSEGRARCWRAMRVLRTFTTPQLCMTADVTQKNAQSYIRALELAGYVTKVRPHESGRAGSFALWRLVRDSGPEAPILRRNRKSVYDPNTKLNHGGPDAIVQPA